MNALVFLTRLCSTSRAVLLVAASGLLLIGDRLPAVDAVGAVKSSAGPPPPPVPAGVKAIRDIAYVKGGGPSQSLDLFVPEKADGPLPIVVWIPGGAWMHINWRSDCRSLAWTTRGYAAASISYRTTAEDNALWPAQIHDCKAAIRFLRANAKKYNLDPNRIGVWGESAGGHLVSLLATSGGVQALEGDLGNEGVSSRVQAVCVWCGPSNFMTIDTPPGGLKVDEPLGPVGRLFGGPMHQREALAKRASPINYVTPNAPPFLIMHGEGDATIPISQGRELFEALTKAQTSVKFEPLKGTGHPIDRPDRRARVLDFFDEVFKVKQPEPNGK